MTLKSKRDETQTSEENEIVSENIELVSTLDPTPVSHTHTEENSRLKERKQQCIDALETLFQKYSDNEMAIDRIHKVCVELFHQSIDTYIQQQVSREEKLNKLREKSEWFMNSFLETPPEYYYFQNNTFVAYDGEKFMLTSEDHISNNIVVMLSNDIDLACRKHKIKATILKRIRERGTGMAVPSSYTIQSVLQPLYPSIFETRNDTKYFLTILGDVLSKKHSENVYFVHHRTKEFIDYIISGLTYLKASSATSLSNLFKYKFQNHAFNTSRVIRIQGEGDTLYYPNLNILDLFFVAQYYSNRYGSADNLLQQPSFSNVARNALILANLGDEKSVIKWFTDEALIAVNVAASSGSPQLSSPADTIDAKTVQYMWKRFCQKMKIPNVIPISTLIPSIVGIEKYSTAYDPEQKVFRGYIGNTLYNPSVGLFIEFWEDTITHNSLINETNQNATNSVDDPYYEFKQLEIDELATLFNSWARKRGHNISRNGFTMLDEDEILSCIKHFYSYVNIEDDKFINGINCSLWDKRKDVFDYIETHIEITPDTTPRSADSIYRTYCNRTLRTSLCVASKGYFERAYNYLA